MHYICEGVMPCLDADMMAFSVSSHANTTAEVGVCLKNLKTSEHMPRTLCYRRRRVTWCAACRRAMEALVDDGLAKAVGVSNFSEAQIDGVLGHARIPPAANQVELHPLLAQRRLVGFCMRKVQAGFQILGPSLTGCAC